MGKKLLGALLILGIIFIFAGFFVQSKPQIIDQGLSPTPLVLNQEIAKVTRVVDGDTIKVLINNKEESVRLIGIDAPETVDPRKPVQCFGIEATEKAKEILDNQTVMLESDSTQDNRDKYGRLLRYVFLNAINFNKLMISQGFAHEYTYMGNPYRYQLEFKNAERDAGENKKGLWADGVCNKM